jgi:hypothetical protein
MVAIPVATCVPLRYAVEPGGSRRRFEPAGRMLHCMGEEAGEEAHREGETERDAEDRCGSIVVHRPGQRGVALVRDGSRRLSDSDRSTHATSTRVMNPRSRSVRAKRVSGAMRATALASSMVSTSRSAGRRWTRRPSAMRRSCC